MRFELPFIQGNIKVHDAIAEAIECKKSGLVFASNSGMRLMHFNTMVAAAQAGNIDLEEVDFQPLAKLDFETPDHEYSRIVLASGNAFGFVREVGGMADLFSLSETRAGVYIASSVGKRCTRPNKPPGQLARKWYHYYPPLTPNALTPLLCKIDGYPLV